MEEEKTKDRVESGCKERATKIGEGVTKEKYGELKIWQSEMRKRRSISNF